MASNLRKLFGSIAQVAGPAIGYAVGGPVGAGVGGAVGSGVSGGGVKGAVSGGLSSMLGSMFGSNAFASPASSASKTALGSIPSYLNPMSGFTNPASLANPSALMAGNTGSSPVASVLNPSAGGGLNRLKDWFGKNKLLASGIGLAGASQLIRSPQVPELPQSVLDYQNMVRGGGSAINQQAQSALSTELARPFEQVSAEEEQSALRQIEKNQADEEKQIRDLYRNLRPGTDPSTDSAFRRDLGDMQDRYARTKADTISQLRRQVSNDFQGNRIRQVLAAQGIDQSQMQNLLQANQYDVDRMLAQLQIDDRDKKYLRDYLLNFGGNMVASQLGTQQQGNGLEELLQLFGGK